METPEKKTEKTNEEDTPLKYIFQTLTEPSSYSNIFTKENFKELEKLGLTQNMEIINFRFNTLITLIEIKHFLKDNDPIIKKNFPPISKIIAEEGETTKKIKYKILRTSLTNKDIFDKIYENNLVSQDTDIFIKIMIYILMILK